MSPTTRILAAGALSALAGLAPARADDAALTPKVLIIGVDGLRPDQMKAAPTWSLDGLIARGAVSLTATNAWRPDQAWNGHSATNWGALLTGRRPDTTGLTANGDGDHLVNDDDHAAGRYRTLFGHLKHHDAGLETAVFCTWGGIGMAEDTILEFSKSVVDHHFHSNKQSTGKAKDFHTAFMAQSALRRQGDYAGMDPDVIFVHLDQIDGAGHAHAYDSEPYREAIVQVDELIGMIVLALDKRPTRKSERWLIMISSDHGGPDGGTGHGDNSDPQVHTVPFILYADGIAPGADLGAVSLYDITPTALAWMGVDTKPLGLEGRVVTTTKE